MRGTRGTGETSLSRFPLIDLSPSTATSVVQSHYEKVCRVIDIEGHVFVHVYMFTVLYLLPQKLQFSSYLRPPNCPFNERRLYRDIMTKILNLKMLILNEPNKNKWTE